MGDPSLYLPGTVFPRGVSGVGSPETLRGLREGLSLVVPGPEGTYRVHLCESQEPESTVSVRDVPRRH